LGNGCVDIWITCGKSTGAPKTAIVAKGGEKKKKIREILETKHINQIKKKKSRFIKSILEIIFLSNKSSLSFRVCERVVIGVFLLNVFHQKSS